MNSRTAITYPSGLELTLDRDDLARLTDVREAGSSLAGYGYRGRSLLLSESRGDQISTSWQHDVARRPAQRIMSPPIVSERYRFDERSLKAKVARIDQGDAGWSYRYDDAGRLTSAKLSRELDLDASHASVPGDLSEIEYAYDSAQNLLSIEGDFFDEALDRTFTIDDAGHNRPQAMDDLELEYDANGNLTRKGDLRLHYDFRNRLVRVSDTQSDIAHYSYDAFNRRTERSVGGTAFETTWSGWQSLENYSNGSLSSRNIYGRSIDEIVRLETDTDGDGQLDLSLVPTYDHAGSVAAWSDPSGDLLYRLWIDPFGREWRPTSDQEAPLTVQVEWSGDGILEIEPDESITYQGDPFELRELPSSGNSLAPNDAEKSLQTWLLPPSFAVTEGRMAGRRLRLELSSEAPAPGTQVRLEIPAESLRDLHLNPLAAPFVYEFTWPASPQILLDTTPPAVEVVDVDDENHLLLTLNEPVDLPSASQSIQLDGSTLTWQAGADPYTLRSVDPLPAGERELSIAAAAPLDRAGKGLDEPFTVSFDVAAKSAANTSPVYEAPDPRLVATDALPSRLGFQGRPQDEETGFYYFRNRYYDPETGRFITKDPLGYVDGPSAYAFAGNSPVNKMDPLGLYEVDFHYYVVYLSAYMALRDTDRANVIAYSSQFVDDFNATKPIRIWPDVYDMLVNEDFDHVYGNLRSFHFLAAPDERPLRSASAGNSLLEMVRDEAMRSGDDVQFGIMLHSYADSFSHEGFVGEVNKFHNYRPDGPYPGLQPLGHAQAGHTVDEPFNDPKKASAAAYAIYSEIYDYGRRTGVDVRHISEESFRRTFESYFKRATGSKDERVTAWRTWISNSGVPGVSYDPKAPPSQEYLDDFERASEIQRRLVTDFFAQAEQE